MRASFNNHKAVSQQVEMLRLADISKFLALQERVKAFQDQRQRVNRFKPRTFEDLNAHLLAGMPILGIKNQNGDMIAQCLLTYPDYTGAINLEAYPIERPERTAVLQSFLMTPERETGHISGELLDGAKEQARKDGRNEMIIQVTSTNKGVIRNMSVRNGFQIYASGHESSLKQDVVYMHYNLHQRDNECTP